MINILNRQPLTTTPFLNINIEELPTFSNEWELEWYHKSGSLKRRYVLSNQDIIKSVSFEQNNRIYGCGSLEFNRLDLPIDAEDYIKVYYYGTCKYKGYIKSINDYKDTKLKLFPFHEKLDNYLVNEEFTGRTIKQILQVVIQNYSTIHNIYWNEYLVDIEDTQTYSVNYSSYASLKEIINEHMTKLNTKEWGVNEQNVFVVYTKSEDITHKLYHDIKPYFSLVDIKKDYGNIKATRYQVFKKLGGGETVRVGEVGYGGNYPTLSIENEFQRIDDKYILDVNIDNTDALNIAYSDLQASVEKATNITINDFILPNYYPNINDYVFSHDKWEKQILTIDTCDSLSTWTGNVSLSTVRVEGDYSILLTASTIGSFAKLDLGEIKTYKDLKNIVLMMKNSEISGESIVITSGAYDIYNDGAGYCGADAVGLNASDSESGVDNITENYIGELNVKYPLLSINRWNMIESKPSYNSFRYILFSISGLTGSMTVNIDRIQVQCKDRKEFEGRIVKINTTIDKKGATVNADVDNYNIYSQQILFDNEEKIKQLQKIQSQT